MTARMTAGEKLKRKRDRAEAARLSRLRSGLKQLIAPLDAEEISDLGKFVETYEYTHPNGVCIALNCCCGRLPK
jgi:hypothetical protein